MTAEQVRQIACAAFEALDESTQEKLADVTLLVHVSPASMPVTPEGTPVPASARGLYVGTVIEAGDNDDAEMGAPEGIVHLFASNLPDADTVKLTVWHEVGHALGLDEDEVADLGL